jgi:hypothetical protein
MKTKKWRYVQWDDDTITVMEDKGGLSSMDKNIAHEIKDEANAKLIAAAPELFEALVEILKERGTDINENINGYDRITQKAISAIKKATE